MNSRPFCGNNSVHWLFGPAIYLFIGIPSGYSCLEFFCKPPLLCLITHGSHFWPVPLLIPPMDLRLLFRFKWGLVTLRDRSMMEDVCIGIIMSQLYKWGFFCWTEPIESPANRQPLDSLKYLNISIPNYWHRCNLMNTFVHAFRIDAAFRANSLILFPRLWAFCFLPHPFLFAAL